MYSCSITVNNIEFLFFPCSLSAHLLYMYLLTRLLRESGNELTCVYTQQMSNQVSSLPWAHFGSKVQRF